jgi:hypothetical protein
MNDKRNVVIMFLLIMLSFAIISEVSAVSDAEADGTGFSLSVKSVDMADHDIAGERFGDRDMQNHDDDFIDDFKSHNEQNSFNQSPNHFGDDKRNEYLYEHNMDVKPDGDRPLDNDSMFRPDGDMPLENCTGFDGFKPMGNASQFDSFKPDGNDIMFKHDENMSFDMKDKFMQPKDLRDNKSIPVQNGELMDDVVSKLIGMNNISPKFKNNQKSPLNDNKNKSKPQGPGDKNSSDMPKDDIKKNPKVVKKSNKNTKKAKAAKKTSKKVKSKKAKKTNKKLAKKSTKERAKL